MPAKSRLVEFNEFCVSAGESARATLITLCNELRSGEQCRKTKALSSPAASGRQNKRAAYTHFKPTWTDRASVKDREMGGMLRVFSKPSLVTSSMLKVMRCSQRQRA